MASGRRRARRRTGVFKGRLRPPAAARASRPRRSRTSASPAPPGRRVYSNGVDLGAGWLDVGQVSGRDFVGWFLAHRDLGPRAVTVMLGRAAAQDDGDVFALVWNPEDGGSPSPAPRGAGALARQGKGKG
ncbi:DUF736 family protein [Caulobacter sp. 602-1]|nr:DUF736 family protein [Caulobacter sp. 602-1]RRN63783.1 DUF736 family protein [Caulobacter sp. 602-1]